MPKKIVSSAKKSKASKERLNRQMRVTVYFGYGLFLLSVIALIISVIPWFSFYSSSILSDSNVSFLLLTFVFSTIIPPLAGYLTGDSATRDNVKLIHHYNGVLFGILGVWVSLIFYNVYIYTSYFTASLSLGGAFYEFLQLSPYVISALILITLGIFYAKGTKHQVSVIEYPPYRTLLVGSAVALILSIGAGSLYGDGIWTTALTMLIIPVLFGLVSTLVGYWILGKKGKILGGRVLQSLIAVGYGLTSISLLSQFATYITQDFQALYSYTFLLGGVVWLGYLILLRRASR